MEYHFEILSKILSDGKCNKLFVDISGPTAGNI